MRVDWHQLCNRCNEVSHGINVIHYSWRVVLWCRVQLNYPISRYDFKAKFPFHISYSMLFCSLKTRTFLNPSVLGNVPHNYEEVMTGLFVSLGGNGLEAEVNWEWTETLLVEQNCTGTCFRAHNGMSGSIFMQQTAQSVFCSGLRVLIPMGLRSMSFHIWGSSRGWGSH